LVLSVLYAGYLQLSKGGFYTPDFITNLVAKQSSNIISGFGYNAIVMPSEIAPNMNLYVNGKYLARIIEGCNAISIIILFVAFIVAFSEKIKKTVLFILAGMVLIYAVNILRIAILAIALYEYPEQKEFLHGVVFPGLIYGMVFLLWMLWVRTLKRKNAHE
jgi:exosortase family protein XrtF